MNRNLVKKSVIMSFVSILVIFYAFRHQVYADVSDKEKHHPKVDPILMELEDAHKKGGIEGARKFAKENHLAMKEGNKVVVNVAFQPGTSAEKIDRTKTAFQAYGVEVSHVYVEGFLADVPIDKIREIADNVEGIFAIHEVKDAEWNRMVKEKIEESKRKEEEREKERIKAGRAQVPEVLLELEEVYKKEGEEEAKKFAGQRGLVIKEGNKIRVYLGLKPGISAEQYDTTTLREYGCDQIAAASQNTLEADIPIEMISKIAEVRDISGIALPGRVVQESYNSEEVSLTGALP